MMCFTRRIRTSGTKGFRIKSMAPSSSPFVSASELSSEVRKMTGISCPGIISCLSLRRVSKPSISGIRISSKMRSGLLSLIYSSSARPDFRAVTRICCLLRMSPAILRLVTSSSTTTTQFVRVWLDSGASLRIGFDFLTSDAISVNEPYSVCFQLLMILKIMCPMSDSCTSGSSRKT